MSWKNLYIFFNMSNKRKSQNTYKGIIEYTTSGLLIAVIELSLLDMGTLQKKTSNK